MKFATIKHSLLAILLSGIGLTGCDDRWNDHYEGEAPGSGLTVYEMIAQDPELSTFKEMLDRSGYAGMLNSTQTFTVWAPVNSALAGFDLEDEALVKRTVLNHIARFNQSSANGPVTGVRMYNGKKFRFDDNGYAGVGMLTPDILCANGVLHTLEEAIPYSYNIREYIDSHSETSRLSEFLARFDQEKFDVENSTPIDVNAQGETVYDSVKIQYNPLLDHLRLGIGPVADEDSVFSMVIPTDAAWDRAYREIRPWFNTASDSVAEVQTSLAVFSHLVFRQNITAPSAYDLLVSTTGSKHTAIDAIFSGADHMPASNGSIWLASTVGQDPLESWNQPLEIESEIAFTRKLDVATKSYSTTMNVAADSEYADEISELAYIYVASSSLDNPAAEFTINDPLSGTYRIYAYFVPAVVDNPTATDEVTRVKFAVTYPRSVTGTRTQTKKFTDASLVTSPTEVTEMYVGEVTFPASHFVDRLRLMDETYDATQDKSNFTIKVQTNVTQSEFNAGTYKRAFRLDRIVLVPVI